MDRGGRLCPAPPGYPCSTQGGVGARARLILRGGVVLWRELLLVLAAVLAHVRPLPDDPLARAVGVLGRRIDDDVLLVTARQRPQVVVALVAERLVGAAVGVDPVVARPAVLDVVARAAGHAVVGGAAVGAVVARHAMDTVHAVAAGQGVVAAAAEDAVVAVAAVSGIVVPATVQAVVAV